MLVALENRQAKVFFLCLRAALIAKAVALLIGLSSDIETIFITEVIPAWIVGIVTGAHCIDIQTLHNLNILYHAVDRDDISAVGIHLVAVCTLDEHRLSIDEKLAVLDFHLAEARFLRDDLHDIAPTVFNGGEERIQIRSLSRPFFHIGEHEAHCALLAFCELTGGLGDNEMILVEQLEVYCWATFDADTYEQHTVVIVILQVGGQSDVADLHLTVACKEITLTGHATQSPEVLVLIERAIAPAKGLEGYEILAWMNIFCDVELCGSFCVLAISYILSVDIEIDI